jgi:TolB-like protein/tetratricopeptide (TPR) repeat protein
VADIPTQLAEALRDRYVIERELGRGGMATVYLARDLKHSRPVALKILLPELAAVLGPDRFQREIRFAARLQHPHILTVLDSGEAAGQLWFTMPYVEGESLRARLARERRLSVADALSVLQDVAQALAYAHRHGVVHRDIKPENILLTEDAALVTDFGVAKPMAAAGDDGVITTVGLALGTPQYMAPEQIAGDPSLDQRADLYAFGVVAYEVLAGEPPFRAASPRAILAAHLVEQAPPLITKRPDVPPQVAQVVASCLEKDPDARPESASAIVQALQAAHTPGGTTISGIRPLEPPRRRRFTRWQLAAGALALLLLLGAGAMTFVPRSSRAALFTILTRGPARLDPGRVLVAPFENETGDSSLAFLGNMTADWISQGLARTGTVDVVDARTAAITSKVVERTPRLLRTADFARALAQETGAGTVIAGSLYRDRDTVRVQARIVAVASGRILHAVDPVSGPAGDYHALIEQVRERTMAALASVVDTTRGSWTVALGTPPSYEAYQELMRAIDSYLTADYRPVFEHLRRARELDSTWAAPMVFEAYVRTENQEYERADTLARTAERQRARLGPTESGMLDFVEAVITGDPNQQLRTAQAVAKASPGSTEIPLLTARIAVETQHPHAALAALELVDPTRGASLATNTYWELKAAAYHLLGNYDRALREAETGLRRVPDDWIARTDQMIALGALGREKEVEKQLDQAESEGLSIRFRGGMARWAYDELMAHQHEDAARALAPRYLQIVQRAAVDTNYRSRQTLGAALMANGRYADAESSLAHLAVDQPNNVEVVGSLAVAAAQAGHVGVADSLTKVLTNWKRVYDRPAALWSQARLAALAGDRARAVQLLEQAVATGQRWRAGGVYYDFHTTPEFRVLHEYPPFVTLMRLRD